MAAASAIAAKLAAQMPVVNARAVRLVTSAHAQPDTRALAAVLQFNTSAESAGITNLDVVRSPSTDDEMAAETAGPDAVDGEPAPSMAAPPRPQTPRPQTPPPDDAATGTARDDATNA